MSRKILVVADDVEVVKVPASAFVPHEMADKKPRPFKVYHGPATKIPAPWNPDEALDAVEGCLLVADDGTPGNPEKPWVVAPEAFEKTYAADTPEPGLCVKTGEVGLIDFGKVVTLQPGETVAVLTKEGMVTVDPAQGFKLARGVLGEIWPMEAKVVKRYAPKS